LALVKPSGSLGFSERKTPLALEISFLTYEGRCFCRIESPSSVEGYYSWHRVTLAKRDDLFVARRHPEVMEYTFLRKLLKHPPRLCDATPTELS